MTPAVFQIPPLFDYVATVAWALSGAVVGIRKRFDLTGVFVIALLSATGGGLMRDAFLQRVPSFLTDPVYLPLIAVTTLVAALFTRLLTGKLTGRTVGKLVDVIDALGMPAFAVIGMQLAEDRGIPIAGVMFVGVVNGVGGGLLRDVVVSDVPTLLRPGQFVSLMLLFACGLFAWLRHRVSPTHAALAAIGAFFLLRVIAVRFNWQSRPVAHGEVPDRGRGGAQS